MGGQRVTRKFTISRFVFFTCAASLCTSAIAQKNTSFAGDDNKFDGDHLRFRANAFKFKEGTADKCAPVDSKLAVVRETDDGGLIVRFYFVPNEKDYKERQTKWPITQWSESLGEPLKTTDEMLEALKNCPADKRVNTFTTYTILKTELAQADYRRTGVTFGGLTVPFKYRLGGNRGITSSTTVAPYVGLRTGLGQSYGLSFTPIVSAGLGLVPVTDPSTSKTETKSAFSFATGFIMGSSKNEKFTSGLLFGRDLLSKSDRNLDPDVNKWWLSFFVGAAL